MPQIREKTLGEFLRRRREELGLSRDELSRKIRVSKKIIEALENESYELFSAKIYTLSFLKKILSALEVRDEKPLREAFTKNWETLVPGESARALPQSRAARTYLAPQGFWFLACLFFSVILILIGWKLTNFTGSPKLILEEPENLKISQEALIRTRGRMVGEGRLTVDGRELMIDELGNFNEDLELSGGLNILEFVAEDKFGKVSREIRYVLVK